MCVYSELLFATATANYATCNTMAFLHGEDQGVNQTCIIIWAANNVEDFITMDNARCSLDEGERNGEKYVEKLCFGKDIEFSARYGSASQNGSNDTGRKEVTDSICGKKVLFSFASRTILVLCVV